MKEIILYAESLTKTYSTITALSNFSIEIRKGEFVALLGANGAGKSTFIRIALGLDSPEAPPAGGQIKLFDVQSSSLKSTDLQKIGYVSSDMSPIPWASINDIAEFYATIYKNWDREKFATCISRWSLDKNKKLKDLSKGQRRLSEFSLIFSYSPGLLILDEPFDGLDAVNRIDLQCILKELQIKKRTTILYTTHVLEEVEKLAERLVIIREGKNVFDTTISSLNDSIENIFKQHYGMVL